MIKKIKLNEFEIGGNKLTIIAGTCAIESKDILFKTADFLKELTSKLNINFIFKSSYDKANRSSINSYRGLGIEKGLSLLNEVKKEFNVPIVTDIHNPDEAKIAAEVADIIQIPAFLCRQTDLLVAAAKTNKIINNQISTLYFEIFFISLFPFSYYLTLIYQIIQLNCFQNKKNIV